VATAQADIPQGENFNSEIREALVVKVTADGTVVIKTERQAAEALEAFSRLKAEIDEIREESGLDDLEKDAVAYKAAVTTFMVENGVDQLQCRGFHGTLVRGFYNSHWVATAEDLTANEPESVVPLQALIEKKFKSSIATKGSKARNIWLKITKRVVDQSKLDEVVAANLLDADEIAAAWVEYEKQPYLRLFDDNNAIRR
jgi:hypothetical protein